MKSSSSSAARAFQITPETSLSDLRNALPTDNAEIYAEKPQDGITTLYFAPHKNAKTRRAHEAIACLIGSGTLEKRMALLEIKHHLNKPLTTDHLISILDKLAPATPASARLGKTASFSSFSEVSLLTEDTSESTGSFSQVSLAEDSDKENKPKT